MANAQPTRLAVLGSPIAHSKSPALQRAAYRVLGLDWQYSAIEVTGETLAEFFRSCDLSWRGLSLTMPLKRDVLALLDWRDDLVELAGGANTVLLENGQVRGFNTDVYGVEQALRSGGIDRLDRALVLGGGATAASALVAVASLGARNVVVAVRTPATAAPLAVLGSRLGVAVELVTLGTHDGSADAVISTLPGGAQSGATFASTTGVLLDVAYDPWPSAIAAQWTGSIVSGLEMLLHQAVAQVRIFVGGSAEFELPNEATVVAAMRVAVGLTP